MKLHHGKHHQTYVDNLNKATAAFPGLQNFTIEQLLSDLDVLDPSIRQAVINHGGGHANHSLYWQIMAPPADQKPEGKLLAALNSTFGDFTKFQEQFTAKAMALFGSGWVFLTKTPQGKLNLKRHSFQNSPLSTGNTPLLTIDVWEHAYYLKYQNRRAEYITAWWHVVNWNKVSELFERS